MNEQVSIIILNYNGKQFLKDCFESVMAQSYPDFEIIFFDNASADGSIEYVKENFTDSRIKIITSHENLGFAGGNNEALTHCTNDLIVLLNNDTKTEKDWLKYLVESVKGKNTVASSFVITQGVPEKYYETNGSVSYMMYNVMNIFPNIEDEFYPNGCSTIFRKSEIGTPFDGDYFYYGEDVHLGLRTRFMGMKIKFVKESVVHHYGSGSPSANEKKTFYSERNRFLNLYQFFSIGFIIKMLPYITFNHTAKTVISIFSPRYSFTGTIKAYLWFYFNIPTVAKKRRALKKELRVDQKEVIKYMSCKVFNDGDAAAGLINRISYMYSRLAGIKPIEYYIKNKIPL
jgi:GT2 family glycosyltransferase